MDHCLRTSLIFVLWLFSIALYADSATQTTGIFSSNTYTLNQLSKIDIATLEGHRPSYTFYLPIPEQWDVNSIDLTLIIQSSPLLLNSSSLSLLVGDTPIDSIRLDNTHTQPFLWKVSIPKAYITKKITSIQIVGYMKISENVCSDLENTANWATISGNSSAVYHFQNKTQVLSLLDFPYPFISKDAPFLDKISFLMPKDMGVHSFIPFFEMANYFAKESSWRGVNFDIQSISELSATALTYPSIMIGTPESINFSQELMPNGFRLINNKWVHNDGSPLKDELGLIWVNNRVKQPLLIISSNTEYGLTTAMDAIKTKRMHFIATNPDVFVAEPVQKTLKQTRKNTVLTFQEMGYKDSTVFGMGQNQLNYQFNVPIQFSNNPVKLVLVYSNSPFLQSNRESTMSVTLNGLPINGVTLVPNSAETKVFELQLPPKQLNLGSNSLTVTFSLLLSEKYCSRDLLNRGWGTIYNTSYIEFYKSTNPKKDQIKSYPQLMVGPLIVALPHDAEVYQNKDLVNELINFATSLNNTKQLQVLDNQSVPEASKIHNIIYLGVGKNNSTIFDVFKDTVNQLISNLNSTSNVVLMAIDKSIFINAFAKSQGVGFVGINAINPEKNHTMLTLYGYTSDELKLSLSLLNNSYKLSFLSGSLAIAFQNGTFTNLSTQEINDTVRSDIAKEKVNRLTLKVILYCFAALVLLVLFFLSRLLRRKK